MKYAFLFFLIVILTQLSGCDSTPRSSDKCKGVVCEEDYECNPTTGTCRKEKCGVEDDESLTGRCSSGKTCQNGVCVDLPCSEENPYGECSEADSYCDFGVCKQYPCSTEHPNGSCGVG